MNISNYMKLPDTTTTLPDAQQTLCGRVSGHKRILRENQTKASFYAE